MRVLPKYDEQRLIFPYWKDSPLFCRRLFWIEVEIFTISKKDDELIVKCHKREINFLSLIDIQQIVVMCCTTHHANISSDNDFMLIKLSVKNN